MAATPTAESVLAALHQYHEERATWPTLKELAEYTGWSMTETSNYLSLLVNRSRITRHRDGTYQPVATKTAQPRTAEVIAPARLPDEAPKALVSAAVPEPHNELIPQIGIQKARHPTSEHFAYPPDEEFAAIAEAAYRTHPDDLSAEVRRRLGVTDKLALTTTGIRSHIQAVFQRLGREHPRTKYRDMPPEEKLEPARKPWGSYQWPSDEEFAALAEEVYRDHPIQAAMELGRRLGIANNKTVSTHLQRVFLRLGRERPYGMRGNYNKRMSEQAKLEVQAEPEPQSESAPAGKCDVCGGTGGWCSCEWPAAIEPELPPEAYPPKDRAPAHVCNCSGECGQCASLTDEGPCTPENSPAPTAATDEPPYDSTEDLLITLRWAKDLAGPQKVGGTPEATDPATRRYMAEPLGAPMPPATDSVMEALTSLGMATDKVLTLRKVLAALVAVDMPEETLRAVVERLVA